MHRTLESRSAFTPMIPAKSAILPAATNDARERGKLHGSLRKEKPVKRMDRGARIDPEANADGKAVGYAQRVTIDSR